MANSDLDANSRRPPRESSSGATQLYYASYIILPNYTRELLYLFLGYSALGGLSGRQRESLYLLLLLAISLIWNVSVVPPLSFPQMLRPKP
jgi:hypothetical protein